MTDDIVIKAENVSKIYKLFVSKTERMKESLHPFKKKYHKEFFALDDINLKVKRGEILGIVGMNGSGKSTLLKIIAGITQQSSGTTNVKGNVVPLLELGSGFNPEFTGLENIYFYNTIMGYSRKETDKILEKILDFAEIGDFINQPVKTYSSGMKARLSFAVSVNIDPDILIIDEVLSVGDELFRRKSFARIEDFFNAGKTILFVSHSAQHVTQLCSRAIMLHNGRIVLEGPSKFVTMNYQKFLFTPPDKRINLLNEFENYTTEEKSFKEVSYESDFIEASTKREQRIQKVAAVKSEAYFIENFTPTSTVINMNANINVSEVKMETLDGTRVNCIVKGDEYIVTYIVHFMEDVGFINHGLGIKTEMGVVVTWRYFPDCNNFSVREYKNGDVLKVTWKFRCTLMPAAYFIGVMIKKQSENGPEVVFKGADIAVFQVMGEKGVDRGGFFDPDFEVELDAVD